MDYTGTLPALNHHSLSLTGALPRIQYVYSHDCCVCTCLAAHTDLTEPWGDHITLSSIYICSVITNNNVVT